MGVDYNNVVITDGLIFYIDAANQRSYSGSGITVNNLVGTGGTLVGGVGYTTTNNGSFTFDGFDDYFITDSATSFNNITNITAEITFKLIGSISGYKHIFNKPLNSNGGTWALYCGNFTNKLTWYLNADASTTNFTDVVVNNIYHYTMTYDLSSIKTYINGALTSTVSYSTGLSYDNTKPINIGRFDTSAPLNSNVNVYSAKIYNRALLSQEVLQNYNATKGRFR